MTLDDFRQSLGASEPPAGLTLALPGLWWVEAIGRERTNPPSRTKGWRVRGFMPNCIARKTIRATRLIGAVGPANLFAGGRSMRNGST